MVSDPRPVSLACADVVELVTDYLEGALDPAVAQAVKAHLDGCPGCVSYLEQMRRTIAVLGTVPLDTLTERAKADLVNAFRDYPFAQ
jgi:anti-sigma factor RsiW